MKLKTLAEGITTRTRATKAPIQLLNKYLPEIIQHINQYTQSQYGQTLKTEQHVEYALDELFSVVVSEMDYLMDEADKDGMVGEWFEDYD